MKKTILLSTAMLAMSSVPAHASSFFSFGIFNPQPVYAAPVYVPPPPPRPVVYSYPVAYYDYYPNYSYVSYDRWGSPIYVRKEQCYKRDKHRRHDNGYHRGW